MRVKVWESGVALWASANDTYDWAHKPGAAWPCSTLSGKRFSAAFDSNGLVELTVNGRTINGHNYIEVDGSEFSAICADLLREKLPEDHPCYLVCVGQFEDN